MQTPIVSKLVTCIHSLFRNSFETSLCKRRNRRGRGRGHSHCRGRGCTFPPDNHTDSVCDQLNIQSKNTLFQAFRIPCMLLDKLPNCRRNVQCTQWIAIYPLHNKSVIILFVNILSMADNSLIVL